MFDHLLNRWMISGEPVKWTKTNRTGKARIVGYIPEDQRTIDYWQPIIEARERIKKHREEQEAKMLAARKKRGKSYNKKKVDIDESA